MRVPGLNMDARLAAVRLASCIACGKPLRTTGNLSRECDAFRIFLSERLERALRTDRCTLGPKQLQLALVHHRLSHSSRNVFRNDYGSQHGVQPHTHNYALLWRAPSQLEGSTAAQDCGDPHLPPQPPPQPPRNEHNTQRIRWPTPEYANLLHTVFLLY